MSALFSKYNCIDVFIMMKFEIYNQFLGEKIKREDGVCYRGVGRPKWNGALKKITLFVSQ